MADSFFISAPGKVILFGEHSAVYGKPAIAAALSLRAYLLVAPPPSGDENIIRLDFPDIQLSYSWNRNQLPFAEVKPFIKYHDTTPCPTDELVPEIMDKITGILLDIDNTFHYNACASFLYLYLHLCTAETPGKEYCIRSTVPIGAGLGSSACTSVCIAGALGLLGGHIGQPTFGLLDKVNNNDVEELDFIDSWLFIGEKTFHGNPSGIDNAVATHGGAVMYQRMTNPSQPSIRTTMRNFPPLKLLLTNTKVPRSTASLVGNVSTLNNAYSNICGPVLEAMGNICTTAYQLMIRPTFDLESKNKLKELANINHGLLVALGVSHPSLEEIRLISEQDNIGVTKLTGAGGGGCAITLVDDEVPEERIKAVIDKYTAREFECYETSLGGKGVGAMFMNESNKSMFSVAQFTRFGSREEIQECLGIESADAWKFW